jgi:hypothetical protein
LGDGLAERLVNFGDFTRLVGFLELSGRHDGGGMSRGIASSSESGSGAFVKMNACERHGGSNSKKRVESNNLRRLQIN